MIATDPKHLSSEEGKFTKSKPSEISDSPPTLDSPITIELKDEPTSAHVNETVIPQKPETLSSYLYWNLVLKNHLKNDDK